MLSVDVLLLAESRRTGLVGFGAQMAVGGPHFLGLAVDVEMEEVRLPDCGRIGLLDCVVFVVFAAIHARGSPVVETQKVELPECGRGPLVAVVLVCLPGGCHLCSLEVDAADMIQERFHRMSLVAHTESIRIEPLRKMKRTRDHLPGGR